MTTVAKARVFALDRHDAQKYGDKPYIVHLDEVAEIVHSLEILGKRGTRLEQAAYLHDVLEDTETDKIELLYLFGSEVASMVSAVTGVGNDRVERMAAISRKIRNAAILGDCGDAATLKMADRLANVRASKENDPKRLAMYRAEYATLRPALSLGDVRLLAMLDAEMG